ncbi:UDP-glucose 4-epimerase [Marinobacterium sp. xm-d-420]|uniref:NAD-dependent epimerase n=1 Tax=Marinobacterium sp. xm-d-420 TaxID=2497737 RepID=UPI001567FE3A|nr:NAD-dependent epimerase [Marinobacterium sp. xm-d-420]NRP26531.1 UDP-glucose 4-epimerase [Marinobacterium sp. xm-d-420]
MKILVTGAAGFIGFHVSKWLCEHGDEVVGIDNLNDYYEVSLKEARLSQLEPLSNFRFIKLDISDRDGLAKLFVEEKFDRVVHLAAQAGVRYSIENPHAYADSNLVGFLNVLEGCRHSQVQHLVYASSSSVYGANESIPFSENDNVDHPVSLYAASKKANEAMAHSYSQLYNLPTTGLRFFTVYGPWGRPDMSPILFAKAITEGKTLKVFNYGKHRRDFTYIDDIVQGVIRTLDNVAKPNPEWSGVNPDPATSKAPWRIYNIGNSQPVELLYYIECIEKSLGKTTKKELLPLQDGDVEHTYADIAALEKEIAYRPNTSIEKGVNEFIKWFNTYY